MRKRILSLLLTVAMVFTLLPATAQAAPGSDFIVTGDPSGYTYGADGQLTFTKPGDYTVAMAVSGAALTTDRIVVDAGESTTYNHVNITLQNVNIDVSSMPYNSCAFDIKEGSTVSLTLRGTNTLSSCYSTAGLHVPDGATLIIDGDGMLTATGGPGSSPSYPTGGAGIGSNCNENTSGFGNDSSGSVIIKGGTIIAIGGDGSAGIGGGFSCNNGYVDISGGTVTAYGQVGSAGIGSGYSETYYDGNGGMINISGGTVTVTGGSVGIGSTGMFGFGTINISGGTVMAEGLTEGAGIGTSRDFSTNNRITIIGGTITAIGGTHGAGIGGGIRGNGGTIQITGGTVTAQGGKYGAGIGGGFNGRDGVDVSGGTVNISGGTVTAIGGDTVTTSTDGAPINEGGGGSGIGGGTNGSGGNVYISGGSVKAIHGICTGTGASAQDIGKGFSGVSDGCLKSFDTAEGEDVYLTELTLSGVSTETAVSSVITDAAYPYGMSDIQTDSSGKLYLYLPAGKKTTEVVTLSPTLTYFEVEDKEYDGDTDADISATFTLSLNTSDCIGGDADNLTANFVVTFLDPDVGQDKAVSLSNSYLTGSAAGNYILDFSDVPTATGNIIPKELTVGGYFTAQVKEYDGTMDATIATNEMNLIGRVGSDDVTLVPVLAFDTPEIGTGKTVSLTIGSSLTGMKSGNYTLSITGAPTYTSGVITGKQLTLGGSFTVNDKEYSGDRDATIATNNLTLVGVNPGDKVSIASVTVEFDSAAAGSQKTVRITGYTLSGADVENYSASLTGAPTATASITRATGLQAPAAPTLQSKTNTSVTLTPKAGQEFSKDNGTTWQTSNIFTGLTPSTEYSFITRIREDVNHEASPVSAALTVKTDASSSTGGGGGGGGGGGTPTPSTPAATLNIYQATVYGVSENSVNVVSAVGIMRGETDGYIIDSVDIDQSKAEEVIQKVLKQKQNKILIEVDGTEDNKADEVNFIIKKAAVKKLSVNEIALEVTTENVRIDIPKETVQAVAEDGKDLIFRVTPLDKKDEKAAVVENAITAKVVQTATGGDEAVALGNPLRIETTYQGYPTKLVFSLKDIEIPEDETQRDLFLSGLGVYVNHSDGEQEFNRGTIIYDSDGNPVGIEIEVSKFSTFTMISIINEAPVASGLKITGKVEYGKKLTAAYNYKDKEKDKEDKSLISWYRADNKKGKNKKLVAEGTLSYKVKKADQGKYLIVEITPVAVSGEITGSTVSACVKVAANKAPKAVGGKITGKTVVGSKLTLKYTYQDAESDKEGKTTIQWYRADSPKGENKKKIKNANKKTYTPTKADVGKYLIVEITPVAKTGTKTGKKTTVATKTAVTKALK